MVFLWWEHMWRISDVWANSGLLWCHNPGPCVSQGHVMDNRPEPSAVCVRGGVTRIGYKYSRALLIMKRCTWAFLSPESRRSPETGRTLWNASSSCSLADCLWRPHQKLSQVQRFSHDTEFLSLALFSCLCFKHAELHDAWAMKKALAWDFLFLQGYITFKYSKDFYLK